MLPLLTIAIPTYNRANILDQSLSTLLPQINNHSTDIELIISDNASTDNTLNIIKKNIKKFPKITPKVNLQKCNTGYYGNFKTCRELANGNYFWLLSDNEQIANGFIDSLLHQIKTGQNVGIFFLINNKVKKSFQLTNLDNLIYHKEIFKITLISRIIMLNNKSNDDYIYETFFNNSFLGFIFLLSALNKNKRIYFVSGEVFFSLPTTVSFNVFESWTKDISAAIAYSKEHNIFDSYQIDLFINNYLRNVVYSHVLNYRLNGTLYGKDYGSLNELKLQLSKFYSNNNFFNAKILPLFSKNKNILILNDFLRRLTNKLLRTISII